MAASDEDFQPPKRFRVSRRKDEEIKLLNDAIPQSTRYKNKWAMVLYEEWKNSRVNKIASREESSLAVNLCSIEDLDIDISIMKPQSLNFWLGKFIQEVTGKNGRRYPGRTLYQIVVSIKRGLEERNRTDVNFLDKSNSE